MIKFSIVVPVYGCPEALEPLCERVTKTLLKMKETYEIILVNDGCPKGSWNIIKEICQKDEHIVGINLSRNFGQIHSTNAGINISKGEYVVLMDCDLQDKPEGIIDLYNKMQEGYDIVFARRKDRKDDKITIILSKLFYKIYNSFVEGHFDGDINNFCIVKRKIVDEYINIKDNNKVFTTVLSWMGYKSTIIDIESEERYEGKSSYNFSKKINLAIDMITSQSNKPLKLVIKLGFFIAFIAMIYIIYNVIHFFTTSDVPDGWTSIIASIFLMGGITLVCLGGVGLYVGNIFNQTKNNPEYLIGEILNEKK